MAVEGRISGELSDGSVTEAKQSLSDVTTHNVSTTKHGYAPKAPNDATQYLDGTGSWSVPAGGGSELAVLVGYSTASNLTTSDAALAGAYPKLTVNIPKTGSFKLVMTGKVTGTVSGAVTGISYRTYSAGALSRRKVGGTSATVIAANTAICTWSKGGTLVNGDFFRVESSPFSLEKDDWLHTEVVSGASVSLGVVRCVGGTSAICDVTISLVPA